MTTDEPAGDTDRVVADGSDRRGGPRDDQTGADSQPGERSGQGTQPDETGQPGQQQGSGGDPLEEGGGSDRRGSRSTGPGGGPETPADGGGQPPADDSPSTGRRVGVFLLSVLLILSVVAASGVLAAQGTALDADYVTETVGETDAAAAAESQVEDTIVGETGSLDGAGFIPDADSLVRATVDDVITEAYISDVLSTNLERLYAYLNGERSDLLLAIDTTPVTEGLEPAVEDQLRQTPVVDLLQQDAFASAFSLPGADLGADRLARAYEDRETYRQVQAEYSRVLEQTGATRDDINQSVVGNTRSQVSTFPSYLQESVFRLQTTFVLGLTSDLPHDEFRERVEAARDDFYGSIARYAQEQVSGQVDDTIDVTGQLSASARGSIDDARSGVQLVSTLGLALPVVALVLALLILLVSHSVGKAARAVGVSLLVAGVLGFAAGTLGGSEVDRLLGDALADTDQELVVETAQALVDGVFAALNTNFLVVAGAGVVLLVVYLVVDRRQPGVVPAGWR